MAVFTVKTKNIATGEVFDMNVDGKLTLAEAQAHVKQLPPSVGAPKGFDVDSSPVQTDKVK